MFNKNKKPTISARINNACASNYSTVCVITQAVVAGAAIADVIIRNSKKNNTAAEEKPRQ